MKIHKINDLSNDYVVSLLTHAFENIPEHNLALNYHPFYKDKDENIFNMLSNGKFNNGNYYVIEDNGVYAGSAGWYQYKNEVSLVLVRAYIMPEYRTKYLMAAHILPEIFKESKSKKLWITCNDYNKSIYDALVSMSQGKSAGLFNSWPPIYAKFKPVGTKVVNNVSQYIAEYER
jgi:hypothetical protein